MASGWDAAHDDRALGLLYTSRDPLSPLSFCTSQRSLALMANDGGESEGDKVFEGCIAGLKDRLGKSEYDKLTRGG
jgi:hypothetical protein